MDIQVKQGDIAQAAADLVIVNLFQGVTRPGGATGAVDRALGGAISDVIAAGDFAGKSGETLVLYTPRGDPREPRVGGRAGRRGQVRPARRAQRSRDCGPQGARSGRQDRGDHRTRRGDRRTRPRSRGRSAGRRLATGPLPLRGLPLEAAQGLEARSGDIDGAGAGAGASGRVPGRDRPRRGGRCGRDAGARPGEHAGQPDDAEHRRRRTPSRWRRKPA